ncbi:MAG: hypothetical protein Kow0088_09960 [Anaerolineales bacterium]
MVNLLGKLGNALLDLLFGDKNSFDLRWGWIHHYTPMLEYLKDERHYNKEIGYNLRRIGIWTL